MLHSPTLLHIGLYRVRAGLNLMNKSALVSRGGSAGFFSWTFLPKGHTHKGHTYKELNYPRGDDMTVATKVLPRASISTETATFDFIPVALFSSVGLLLSLAIMILDMFSSVEWF